MCPWYTNYQIGVDLQCHSEQPCHFDVLEEGCLAKDRGNKTKLRGSRKDRGNKTKKKNLPRTWDWRDKHSLAAEEQSLWKELRDIRVLGTGNRTRALPLWRSPPSRKIPWRLASIYDVTRVRLVPRPSRHGRACAGACPSRWWSLPPQCRTTTKWDISK